MDLLLVTVAEGRLFGKDCSFVNDDQFVCALLALLVLRVGCGI